jgi:predicted amidohydrolase
MGRVRCCAVGLRIDPGRATSTSAFLTAMRELLDREVEPHPDAPTLVALPEHTGLLTMFVGPRGEAARGQLIAGAGTLEALMALATSYGEVLGHYAARFPDVRSAGTLLHLACTDVMVRTIVDGFSTLAEERDLWITVGAALPDWELRDVDDLDDEAAATLLGPDPMHADVYVPTGPQVRNRNLVFAPTGELVAVHDKAYLVPLEADAEQGLGLSAAGLDEITVAELPFGRLGTVISKDAWMPDVNERLGQLGAQLVIQPEAFDRWGLVDREGGDGSEVADLWPPDKFQRGGWWMVQRHPCFRVNVAPMLLGRLGDLRFDGQALIAVPSPAGDPQLGLLGQPHDAGWAAVGPWAGLDEPASTLADERRRAAFEELAVRLASAPSVPAETSVSEGAVWADVEVPGDVDPVAPLPRPHGLPPSVAVDARGTHLVPDLASDGSDVWLAWIEVDGPEVQAVSVAQGDGAHWQRPERIGPASVHGWRPRLTVGEQGPTCLFLGFPNDNWELFSARRDGGWDAPARVDDAHDDPGVLRERLHDAPVVLRVGDGLLAAWSDLRWPWVFPQVRYAWSHDDGTTWSASARIDGRAGEGESDPLQPRSAEESRGQTTPAVAVTDGTVLVAYQERDGRGVPAIHLRRIVDGTPGPAQHLGRAGVGDRVARPAVAAVGADVWLVWERWDAEGGAVLVVRRSSDGGRTWSAARPVDPGRPAGVTQRYATLVPGVGDSDPSSGATGTMVVFEDDRAGVSSIVVARLGDAGETRPPVRVDDGPVGTHARAPTATRAGYHLVVAWQDARRGAERIRTVRFDPSLLG